MATWPVIIDDDGTGTGGTPTDKALFDQIKGYVDEGSPPGVITIVNGGTNVFDVVLPTPRAVWVVDVVPVTAAITIRSATGGRLGDLLLIVNSHLSPVWLTHAATGALLPFWHSVTSAPTPLGLNGSALYMCYPGNVWRLVQHEQGGFITPTFSAANFFAAGSMTWTVNAGHVTSCRFRLRGQSLELQMHIAGGVVGGTLSNALIIYNAAWGNFTIGGQTMIPIIGAEAGANAASGFMALSGGVLAIPGTQLWCMKNGFVNWTAGVATVSFSSTFVVT